MPGAAAWFRFPPVPPEPGATGIPREGCSARRDRARPRNRGCEELGDIHRGHSGVLRGCAGMCERLPAVRAALRALRCALGHGCAPRCSPAESRGKAPVPPFRSGAAPGQRSGVPAPGSAAGTGPAWPHGGDVEPELGPVPRALPLRPFCPARGFVRGRSVSPLHRDKEWGSSPPRFLSITRISLWQAALGSASPTGRTSPASPPTTTALRPLLLLQHGGLTPAWAGGAAPASPCPTGVTPGAPDGAGRRRPPGGPGPSRRSGPWGQRRPWRMAQPLPRG